MQDFYTIIFKIITNINSAICLFGAVMLFVRGKNNRARRMLGYTLSIWGICSLIRTVLLEAGILMSLITIPLRPVGLIGGNIIYVLLMFYPLEVLLPGWLKLKRLFFLFLPNILLTVVYLLILTILKEPIIELSCPSEVFKYITHFNVWFRFLYLILIILYVVFLLKLVYTNEKKYIQWRNDNYSDVEYMDVSWMRLYAFYIMMIFTAWMFNVLLAYSWNYVLHAFISNIGFSYIIYKSLFYKSAYPEEFFKYINGTPLNVPLPKNEEICMIKRAPVKVEIIESNSFSDKIPLYVEKFEMWMEEEKPYLHQDFKLSDVATVLPLNRSYLSRMFNEGMGMNFCHVVRKYRIETAKVILKEHPNIPLYLVAEQCGFSSDTIFFKAFQQEMNMTPAKYRLNG